MSATQTNFGVMHGPKSRPATFGELGIPSLPEKTNTYTPLGHQDLVTRVQSRLQDSGLEISQDSHVMWRNGLRYFGMMQVFHPELKSPDHALVVGLRNSYDKSLPAMLTSGVSCLVCDNMCFNGEIVLGRKHTKNIFDDLNDLISGAIDVLFKHWNIHFSRVESYRNTDISDTEAHDTIANAYRAGAISKTQVADVINQWHSPNYNEFKDRNLFSLHSAFTESWKGRLDILPLNSKLLHVQLDKIAKFVPENVSLN